ncbi:hypothetical protein LBMAG53_23700 [Planctomycetota bacterium]|nr:hypothetical protein LBMAG53_23700 [Planctomycetota bacterium]
MPDRPTQDRGFKELFTEYPQETLEVFVPELLAKYGRPAKITVISQELPVPDLSEPSRFLDVALECAWNDGRTAIIVLIEHWSEGRRVDLDRVHLYFAALRCRNRKPKAEVFPIVLVTDASAKEIEDTLTVDLLDERILTFKVRIYRVTAEQLPRLRAMQNRVAQLLSLLATMNAVDDLVQVLLAMHRAPGPVDDLSRFLSFAQLLAKLPPEQEAAFHRRLRQEPAMYTVFDEVKDEGRAEGRAEGEAKGRAEGRAEGLIALIRHRVAKGKLTIDEARAEVQELIADGDISAEVGQKAFVLLG